MKMKITQLRKQMCWLACALIAFAINASAQNSATVTGTVMSDNGELLTGVTIKALATGSKETLTTTTNEKGLFNLKLSVGVSYSLSASYVGYDQNTATV